MLESEKPGTVKWEQNRKETSFPYVDPRESYVYAREEDGTRRYIAWHRIAEVRRDV